MSRILMSAVERRTLRAVVSILVLLLAVSLLFIPIASAGVPKIVYGYVYYEDEGPASGVNVSMYISNRSGEVLYDTTDVNGRWDQNVGNFPYLPGWSVGETLIINANTSCGSDNTSMVLDAGAWQQADDMHVVRCRPGYPTIDEYVDNMTKQTTYILNFSRIFLGRLRNHPRSDTIYKYFLGLTHWFFVRGSDELGILTDQSKLRSRASGAFDTAADELPGMLGPPNGTRGISYLANHSVRVNATLVRVNLNYSLWTLRDYLPVLADVSSIWPDVFGWSSKPIW